MPLELGSALSIEREPLKDPEIRVQTLEAIYLISLQVKIQILEVLIFFFFPLLVKSSAEFIYIINNQASKSVINNFSSTWKRSHVLFFM